LTDRINNEYSHLCGIFERGELPTEVPEMLKTAKLIMTTLSTKHPEQYAALIASVVNKPLQSRHNFSLEDNS
jgi:hypothetical protein